MKYIKNFQQHSQYTQYAAVNTIKPSVSYCKDAGDVHYDTSEEGVFSGFCMLTLNDDTVVNIVDSGQLTSSMIQSYKNTCVKAHIGNQCTSIASGAFQECPNLARVLIDDSVTSIGEAAFYQCTSLANIVVGNGVTTIGAGAFNSLSSALRITLGSAVTSIGDGCFQNCTSLISLTILAPTPPALFDITVLNNTNNCTFYVPATSLNAYKEAGNWNFYASRIYALP